VRARGALLRTCRVAVLKSKLGSPWAVPIGQKDHGGVPTPVRLALAASMRRSTSASVRRFRVRKSRSGRRLGVTVRFTVAGATSFRRPFLIYFILPERGLFVQDALFDQMVKRPPFGRPHPTSKVRSLDLMLMGEKPVTDGRGHRLVSGRRSTHWNRKRSSHGFGYPSCAVRHTRHYQNGIT
jgi:hypothetical protein